MTYDGMEISSLLTVRIRVEHICDRYLLNPSPQTEHQVANLARSVSASG
jgi:hypothetical protein